MKDFLISIGSGITVAIYGIATPLTSDASMQDIFLKDMHMVVMGLATTTISFLVTKALGRMWDKRFGPRKPY